MSDCSFVLEPLAQSDMTSLANLPSLNYTNQDFHSMKTRLVAFIQEKFTDDFTDFVEGDLAIMLIENWAFLADTLSFKLDQIVNELFIDTVAEIENAFRLCRLVGFHPTPPIAAKAMFSATIQSPAPTQLIIPSGFRVDVPTNGQTISFELFPADADDNPIFDQNIIIDTGDITNTSIVGLEGQTRVDTFTATGQINQIITLNSTPVVYDSVRIDVDGVRWEKVDYFTDSKGRNEYRLEHDSDWAAYVIFGNGKAGRTPTVGSEITATYRVGGGVQGNIITGFAEAQMGFNVPGFNYAVPVTFRNYTRADNGYDGDTLEDIRRKLPKYNKAQDRAVTGEDYKTLADQFASPYNGQIGKSTAVLRNYGCAGNIVDLYVLARNGADDLQEASDNLKSELSEYMTVKKMMTHHLCIKDGVVILTDVVLDVTIDKFFRKFKEELDRKIRQRIDGFFALPNWDYGRSLKDLEMLRVLADMREVKDVSVTFTTTDAGNSGSTVFARYYEIIRKDTLAINLGFE